MQTEQSQINARTPDATNGNPVSDITKNIIRVVRSELNLALTELKHATAEVKARAAVLGIGAACVLLGAFPLMAFLCIGLGRILGDNYWLSSLIVGLLFTGGGAFAAYRAIQGMHLDHLALPRTRETLQDDGGILRGKVQNITGVVRQDLGQVTQLPTRRAS